MALNVEERLGPLKTCRACNWNACSNGYMHMTEQCVQMCAHVMCACANYMIDTVRLLYWDFTANGAITTATAALQLLSLLSPLMLLLLLPYCCCCSYYFYYCCHYYWYTTAGAAAAAGAAAVTVTYCCCCYCCIWFHLVL